MQRGRKLHLELKLIRSSGIVKVPQAVPNPNESTLSLMCRGAGGETLAYGLINIFFPTAVAGFIKVARVSFIQIVFPFSNN